MSIFDQVILLVTGLVALYLVWRFYTRYKQDKKLYSWFALLGILAITATSINASDLKTIAVPVFQGLPA